MGRTGSRPEAVEECACGVESPADLDGKPFDARSSWPPNPSSERRSRRRPHTRFADGAIDGHAVLTDRVTNDHKVTIGARRARHATDHGLEASA